MSKIVGFGAAEVTLAKAKAVWPKCLSPEFGTCELSPGTSTYPGCPAITALHNEDDDTYHQMIDATPYCNPSAAMTDKLMWAAAGLLGGFVLGWMMR
jgi:hypothetical protein